MNLKSKPITIWYIRHKRKNEQERWSFNHIEDGHTENIAPIPKNEWQKQKWGNEKWYKNQGYLENNKVILGTIPSDIKVFTDQGD